MITIIYGAPGVGKTCFLTHTLNLYAFSKERKKLMSNEIVKMQNMGLPVSAPLHPVSANYPIEFRKFGYSRRMSRLVNPFRLGLKNEFVKTHYCLPYEVIGITEAQTYFNSRMSLYYPDWQSRFFEEHRHYNLDIFMDCQRSGLIDLNIRELARFIEIVSLRIKTNEKGVPLKLEWIIREFDNNFLNDKYLSSGKTDRTTYRQEKVVADYNVFALYDSQVMKPKFIEGHFSKDFDYELSKFPERSIDGYKTFCKMVSEEIPEGFYQKRTTKTG